MITDQTIIAGCYIEWREYIPEFPASMYDLEVTIKLAGNLPKVLDVSKDNDTFIISIPNDLIAENEFGDYQYQYKFKNLSNNKTFIPLTYRGFTKVLPDLNSDADTRTDDEIVLQSLIDARKRVANREYVNITINGKSTQFKTLNEIDAQIIRLQKKLGIYKTPTLINSFG